MTATMRITAAWLTCLLVVACSINLDAPILPNLGKKFPEGTNEQFAGKDLTPISKGDANAKRWLVNLSIDEGLADDLSLERDENCVQLVELSNGTVVLDYANVPCPSNNEKVDVSAIQFTTAYAPVEGFTSLYSVKSGGKVIGEMEINEEGTSLTLKRLCTGRYDTICFANVDRGRFLPIYVW